MKHLTRAFDGQNQWWKYLLVLLIAFGVGQTLGGIPLVVAIAIGRASKGSDFIPPENQMDFSAYGIDANLGLALSLIPFVVTLILAVVFIRVFHKRSSRDVVNGGSQFRVKRFGAGVALWGVIMLLLFAVQLVLFPGELQFQYNPSAFYPLLVVALLLIPIQSGTEEFLFRGYLAQGIAAWTKRLWLVIFIPSLLFALLHSANPEVKEFGFWIMMPSYFVMGGALAIVAILDNGIEMAIGIHAVNNCLGAILVTSKSSALQTPALFFQEDINPVSDFIGLFVALIVMLVVGKVIFKWDFKCLCEKIGAERIG